MNAQQEWTEHSVREIVRALGMAEGATLVQVLACIKSMRRGTVDVGVLEDLAGLTGEDGCASAVARAAHDMIVDLRRSQVSVGRLGPIGDGDVLLFKADLSEAKQRQVVREIQRANADAKRVLIIGCASEARLLPLPTVDEILLVELPATATEDDERRYARIAKATVGSERVLVTRGASTTRAPNAEQHTLERLVSMVDSRLGTGGVRLADAQNLDTVLSGQIEVEKEGDRLHFSFTPTPPNNATPEDAAAAEAEGEFLPVLVGRRRRAARARLLAAKCPEAPSTDPSPTPRRVRDGRGIGPDLADYPDDSLLPDAP